MDFLELARKRYSVRCYDMRPVPEEALEKILEAGRLAPSAVNRQPCHFIVVRDDEQRRKLGTAYPRDWFWRAPVIIVVCVETARAWVNANNRSYGDVDGAIVADHMTLCATSLGLGTCWIAAFDPVKVTAVLNLPEGVIPLVMLPVGYAVDPERGKSRKPLAEMVHREKW